MANVSLGQQAVNRGNSIEVKSLIDQGAHVDYRPTTDYYWDDVNVIH